MPNARKRKIGATEELVSCGILFCKKYCRKRFRAKSAAVSASIEPETIGNLMPANV
jgi:hypothetical protein